MSQRLAAIDFSETGARIICADTSLRSAEITSTFTLERDLEEESFEDFLERLHGELPEGTDSVIVGSDSKRMSLRSLEFPFSDLRKLDAGIDFELETLVPFGVEDITTTWEVTQKESGLTRVLAGVIPREVLESRLEAYEDSGLRVRAFTSPASSMGELVVEGFPELKSVQHPVALLAVGASECHLAILKEGRMVYVRTFRAGGDNIDRILAERFHSDLEVARETKETQGGVLLEGEEADEAAAALSAAVREGLRPIMSSLAMTLRSVSAEFTPQELYLTGGLSRLHGIGPYLADSFKVPVHLLDLKRSLEGVEAGRVSVGAEYAPALGMLLGLIRRGSNVALNFRRKEYAYQGDLQLYKGQIKHMAVGLSLVILLALGASIMRYSLLSEDEARVDQAFCDATERIVGREICNPVAAIATLKEAPGAGEGIFIPKYSASGMLEAMSKLVDPSLDVVFGELDFRLGARGDESDRITGKGDARTFEAVEQLVTGLKADPCVEEAEVSKQRKKRNSNRVEFSLTVRLKCPPGVLPGTATLKTARVDRVEEKGDE